MVFSTHGVARLIDLSSVIFHSKLYHVTIIQPIRSYFPNFWYCMKAFKMFHPSISLVMGSSAWKMVWASPRRFELWIPNIWGICSTSQINGNFELFTKLKKTGRWIKHPVSLSMRFLLDTAQEKSTVNFRNMGRRNSLKTLLSIDGYNQQLPTILCEISAVTLDWHPLVFFGGAFPGTQGYCPRLRLPVRHGGKIQP